MIMSVFGYSQFLCAGTEISVNFVCYLSFQPRQADEKMKCHKNIAFVPAIYVTINGIKVISNLVAPLSVWVVVEN